MTERRAHWSDDLIEAVFRIMDDYAAEVWRREHDHGTPTFDIIAAVEDWQKQQDIGGDWGTVAWSVHMYQHYVTSEAAISRVRELCEQTTVSVSIGCRCYTDECSGTCGAGRPLSWHLNPAAVFAALDGDSDE